MTRPIPESHPLHRLFRGLTETTFLDELGIGDPGLVGYVARLLARFVPIAPEGTVRDSQGRPITEVSAMIAEAEASPDQDRRRECHRLVGDFTLFWTGVYPEALPRMRSRSADGLINFSEQGKLSYYVASTYDGDEARVLRRLSDEFDLCAFGLSRVRKEWERHDAESMRGPRRPIFGT